MKKTVEITMESSFGPFTSEAECFFIKNFLSVTASCEKFGGYIVIHIPTGYAIYPSLSNKRLAIKFCRELAKLYDWEKIKSPAQSKRMHALKKKVDLIRKRLKVWKNFKKLERKHHDR